MAPTITFLPGGTWNSDTEAVEFWAEVNGRQVRCRVFWEALAIRGRRGALAPKAATADRTLRG